MIYDIIGFHFIGFVVALDYMRVMWLRQFHHFTAVDDFGDRARLAFATNEIRATPVDGFVRAAIFDEFRTLYNQRPGTVLGADEFG